MAENKKSLGVLTHNLYLTQLSLNKPADLWNSLLLFLQTNRYLVPEEMLLKN